MSDHTSPAKKFQTLCDPTLAEGDHEERTEDPSFWTMASPAAFHDDHDEDPFPGKADAEQYSGFSKYKAHILPQEDITSREAQIAYAKEASFTELKFPSRKRRTGGRCGGGIRGKILSFTHVARRKMRQFTAKIKRNSQALHVCLTYPEDYPEDPTLWKVHLERFLKRFDRHYGKHAVIWRMEFQERGAPHYHLLIFFSTFLPISKPTLSELRGFVASAWYEVCGEISEEHLEAGTSVERVRSLVG